MTRRVIGGRLVVEVAGVVVVDVRGKR